MVKVFIAGDSGRIDSIKGALEIKGIRNPQVTGESYNQQNLALQIIGLDPDVIVITHKTSSPDAGIELVKALPKEMRKKVIVTSDSVLGDDDLHGKFLDAGVPPQQITNSQDSTNLVARMAKAAEQDAGKVKK